MMQRIVGFVVLFCMLFNLRASDSVVDEIKQLRAQQQTASLREYYTYENKISERKREAGTSLQPSSASWLWVFIRDAGHTMPFIIWQLLALIFLFFMMVKKNFSWLVTLAFCGVLAIVGVQQYERSQQWLIVSKADVVMRLGPGNNYPVAGKLGMLDEVRILENREGWHKISFNGMIGWLPQEVGNDQQ